MTISRIPDERSLPIAEEESSRKSSSPFKKLPFYLVRVILESGEFRPSIALVCRQWKQVLERYYFHYPRIVWPIVKNSCFHHPRIRLPMANYGQAIIYQGMRIGNKQPYGFAVNHLPEDDETKVAVNNYTTLLPQTISDIMRNQFDLMRYYLRESNQKITDRKIGVIQAMSDSGFNFTFLNFSDQNDRQQFFKNLRFTLLSLNDFSKTEPIKAIGKMCNSLEESQVLLHSPYDDKHCHTYSKKLHDIFRGLFRSHFHKETNLLYQNKVETVASTFYLLDFAALRGDQELCEYLIEKGHNIHQVNGIGATPLHFAAASGNLNLVTMFVNSGLELTVQAHIDSGPAIDRGLSVPNNLYTKTALCFSLIMGHEEVALYLLEKGAGIKEPEYYNDAFRVYSSQKKEMPRVSEKLFEKVHGEDILRDVLFDAAKNNLSETARKIVTSPTFQKLNYAAWGLTEVIRNGNRPLANLLAKKFLESYLEPEDLDEYSSGERFDVISEEILTEAFEDKKILIAEDLVRMGFRMIEGSDDYAEHYSLYQSILNKIFFEEINVTVHKMEKVLSNVERRVSVIERRLDD